MKVAPNGDFLPPINKQEISLRDYFAAAALHACITAAQGWDPEVRAGVANMAYNIADAMLAERERTR